MIDNEEEGYASRMAQPSRIIKVAGLSLAGFCAVSLMADKVAVSPETSQLAGYCGAFLGALVGRTRGRRAAKKPKTSSAEAPLPDQTEGELFAADK